MKRRIIIQLCIILLLGTSVLTMEAAINEFNNETPYLLQYSGVEWVKTYGGSEFDMFHCIHQTQDGGYLASGATEVSNNYYPLLLKLNSVGEEEWHWTINEISYEHTLYDILDVYPIFSNQVSDGGYLFCLWLDINNNEEVPCIAGLFKFNENGEEEWVEFYSEGFDWVFRPISFIEVEDGYVVCGTSGEANSYMGNEAALLKIDIIGKELWYKEFDFGDDDNYDNRMEGVCKTSDGGYILSGWGSDTSVDYWMIKTDENGDEQWNKIFGGSGDDYCHTKDCYQTSDGGFVLGGFSSSFGAGRFDVWVVKTDVSGSMVWNKTYGGTKNDLCWGMESASDGGFVVVATINYDGFTGDKDDINLVKIDNTGNIVEVQEYAGPERQIGTSVDMTNDGGFIVSGYTDKFHSSNSDGLIVKFASFENERPNKPSTPNGSEKGKPDIEYTFTTSTSDPDGDLLLYKWDWGDGNFTEGTAEESHIWTSKAVFKIQVMAIDEYGGESDWSDPLYFSTPRNKLYYKPFFRFIENHPRLFPLLRHILKI